MATRRHIDVKQFNPMGRKTNPNILRITSITHAWEPRWFAGRRKDFRDRLQQDFVIRDYLKKELRHAAISRVDINRDQKELSLTIHTSRPAVVIGRGGSNIEQIQKDLKKKLGPDFRARINVQEISNPDTNAATVAAQVVEQLERRMPYRRVLKQVVSQVRAAGAVGVKVSLSGRLNGAEIARREWLSDGNVPLHTFRADVDFAKQVAVTSYGTIGVKVWINRGEIDKDNQQVAVKKQHKDKPRRSRRKHSLADKAAKSPKVKKSSPKKKS